MDRAVRSGSQPYIESEYEPEKGAISESNKLDVFESSLLRNVKRIDFTVTDDQDDEEYYYYRDNYITKAFCQQQQRDLPDLSLTAALERQQWCQ